MCKKGQARSAIRHPAAWRQLRFRTRQLVPPAHVIRAAEISRNALLFGLFRFGTTRQPADVITMFDVFLLVPEYLAIKLVYKVIY